MEDYRTGIVSRGGNEILRELSVRGSRSSDKQSGSQHATASDELQLVPFDPEMARVESIRAERLAARKNKSNAADGSAGGADAQDGLSRYFSTVAPMADWIAYPHPLALVVEFPQSSMQEDRDEAVAKGVPAADARIKFQRRQRRMLRRLARAEERQDQESGHVRDRRLATGHQDASFLGDVSAMASEPDALDFNEDEAGAERVIDVQQLEQANGNTPVARTSRRRGGSVFIPGWEVQLWAEQLASSGAAFAQMMARRRWEQQARWEALGHVPDPVYEAAVLSNSKLLLRWFRRQASDHDAAQGRQQ